VVGPSNPHSETIAAAAASMRWQTRLVENVRDMMPLMRAADLALASSGSTTWELAAMGVPSIVVPIADNQIAVAKSLECHAAAIALPAGKDLRADVVADVVRDVMLDPARRRVLSQNARRLVDGKGASRVARAMLDMSPGVPPLAIREAREADSRLLWEWANDLVVRSLSFSPEPIPFETHVSWFAQKLSDPDVRLYIGLGADDEPIGQVRFDIDDAAATLSISVAGASRGRGYGAKLVDEAVRRLFQTSAVELVEAFVKPDNAASLAVFRKAGFTNTGARVVRGQPAVRFILQRSMLP